MAFGLYKFLNFISSPILFLFVFIRLLKGKESKARLKERFGIPSYNIRPKGKLIWFHATSVGEVIAVLPTLNAIAQDKRFGGTILLTSTTLGSLKLLEKRSLRKNIIHQLYPIDNFFTIKRFMDFWKPDLVVFVESEFWPCTLSKAASISNVISLNTSISDKSFKRWMATKLFSRPLLSKINKFFPKSVTDLQRLKHLGFSNATHIGNLKYSAPSLPFDQKELDNLKHITKGRKIVLFASTHPGEDELAIEAYKVLKEKHPKLLFVLIPRHITRVQDITHLINKASLSFVLKSNMPKEILKEVSFYIVDTIGETGLFFALSPITVMGGSFAAIGGHNLIEPAKLNSVVISGPHTNNFKDIIEEFKEKKAACFAEDNKECITLIEKLLNDASLLNKYKKNATNLLANKENIITQVADKLLQYLN
jgi:3-deoxy-D-manno-octulosonic-acid transferase